MTNITQCMLRFYRSYEHNGVEYIICDRDAQTKWLHDNSSDTLEYKIQYALLCIIIIIIIINIIFIIILFSIWFVRCANYICPQASQTMQQNIQQFYQRFIERLRRYRPIPVVAESEYVV